MIRSAFEGQDARVDAGNIVEAAMPFLFFEREGFFLTRTKENR